MPIFVYITFLLTFELFIFFYREVSYIFFSELKFDAVVASEVIEHVENPQVFIQTISSLLKVRPADFLVFLVG